MNLATVARKAQDPTQETAYTQQYNFGIQRELGSGLVLDVAYVGNRGLHVPAFRNLNPNVYSFNAQGAPVVGLRQFWTALDYAATFNIWRIAVYLTTIHSRRSWSADSRTA